MAVANERVARRFEAIVADVPIPVDIAVFEKTDVYVYYGTESLFAVQNVDFTVTLDEENFNSFTVTPTASLLAKINALIAADPVNETNFITVRRFMNFMTDTSPGAVRDLEFLSREFDRTALRFAQMYEQAVRSLTLGPRFVDTNAVIDELVEGTALIYEGGKIKAGPNAADVANAQQNAALALQYKEEAQAARDEAVAKENSMVRQRGAWFSGIILSPSDQYTFGGELYGTLTAHISTDVVADVLAGRALKLVEKGAAGPGTGDMLKSENLAGLASVINSLVNLEFSALAIALRTAGGVAAHTPGTNAQGQGLLANNVLFAYCDAVSSLSGVTLPEPVVNETGRQCVIINPAASTADINVYPAAGDNLEGLAANAPVSVPPGWQLTVLQRTTAEWAYVLTPRKGRKSGVKARLRMSCTQLGGTYSRAGNTVTVTYAAHGLSTGMKVLLDFTSGTATDGYYVVTVTGANTFTVQDAASGATSGNVTIRARVFDDENVFSVQRVALGQYLITLATAMDNANYEVVGTSVGIVGVPIGFVSPSYDFTQTTTQFRVNTATCNVGVSSVGAVQIADSNMLNLAVIH